MQWFFEDDRTRPIFTAEQHISGKFPPGEVPRLPKRALLFCLSGALSLLRESFGAQTLLDELPGFITRSPVLTIPGQPVCFLDGGRGAPQAASTAESLHALGVEEMLVVGLCGVFGQGLEVGDVLVPEKILSEEGASQHYFADKECALPSGLWSAEQVAAALPGLTVKQRNTVTTDAVYRQTFYKEAKWREQGFAGVDMEASAIVNVCEYYGLKSGVLLMASDRHPQTPESPKWRWGGDDYALYKAKQKQFLTGCTQLAMR